MYGPTRSFLLMFEFWVRRHSFVALTHSTTTCIPRVNGLSMDTGVSHNVHTKFSNFGF